MTPSEQPTAAHDDLVAQGHKGPPSQNPIAAAASITLSLPESVEVKLVDASALGDYEVWVLLTSILSSAVIGFTVATLQATDQVRGLFVGVTLIFAVLLVVAGWMAITKRRRLASKTRRLRFRIGEILPADPGDGGA